MIYNENGIIINDYTTNESVLEYINNYHKIDELLQEAINMKNVKLLASDILALIINKISAIIDWIQRLPFLRKINIIKKNKNELIKIIDEILYTSYNSEYMKALKHDIAKYMHADFTLSLDILDECIYKLQHSHPTKEEIEKILYGKEVFRSFTDEELFGWININRNEYKDNIEKK